MIKNKTLSTKFLSVSLSFMIVTTGFILFCIAVPDFVRADDPEAPFEELKLISEDEVFELRDNNKIYLHNQNQANGPEMIFDLSSELSGDTVTFLIPTAFSAGDWDGDGKAGFVIGWIGYEDNILIWQSYITIVDHPTGDAIYSYQAQLSHFVQFLAMGDEDGDGQEEVFELGDDNRLYIFDNIGGGSATIIELEDFTSYPDIVALSSGDWDGNKKDGYTIAWKSCSNPTTYTIRVVDHPDEDPNAACDSWNYAGAVEHDDVRFIPMGDWDSDFCEEVWVLYSDTYDIWDNPAITNYDMEVHDHGVSPQYAGFYGSQPMRSYVVGDWAGDGEVVAAFASKSSASEDSIWVQRPDPSGVLPHEYSYYLNGEVRSLAMADWDGDSFTVLFTGDINEEVTDGSVIALLSAPPYENGIYLGSPTTAYGMSLATGESQGTSFSVKAGLAITAGYEIPLIVRFQFRVGFNWELTKQHSEFYSVTDTDTYHTTDGKDVVVIEESCYNMFKYWVLGRDIDDDGVINKAGDIVDEDDYIWLDTPISIETFSEKLSVWNYGNDENSNPYSDYSYWEHIPDASDGRHEPGKVISYPRDAPDTDGNGPPMWIHDSWIQVKTGGYTWEHQETEGGEDSITNHEGWSLTAGFETAAGIGTSFTFGIDEATTHAFTTSNSFFMNGDAGHLSEEDVADFFYKYKPYVWWDDNDYFAIDYMITEPHDGYYKPVADAGDDKTKANGNPVEAGVAVTFDASNSYDPNGDALDYRWDFNGDGDFDDTNEGWGSSSTKEHTYSTHGRFTVKLEVRDGTASDPGTTNPSTGNSYFVDEDTLDVDVYKLVKFTNSAGNVEVEIHRTGDSSDGKVVSITDEDPADFVLHPGTSINIFVNIETDISSEDWDYAIIRMYYEDSNPEDGFVDNTDSNPPGGDGYDDISEYSLEIWQYVDPDSYCWQAVPNKVLNPTDNYIQVEVTHFSIYAAFGNCRPFADAGPDQNVNKGETVTFDGSGSMDQDGTIVSYDWDFDDGSPHGTEMITTHQYQVSGTYNVVLTVTDDDGETHSDTCIIAVENQLPVAIAGGPYSGNEGDTIQLDGSGSYDPDGDPLTYWWDLDNDGNYDDSSIINPTMIWYDEGSYTINLAVYDGENWGYDTATVNVNNVAPTADLNHDGPKDEGSSVTVTFSNQYDPGIYDTFLYSFDWNNDGDFLDPGEVEDQVSPSASHIWSDNGIYQVKGRIKDNDGDYTEYTISITVFNVNPVVEAGEDQTTNEGTQVLFLGSFTDPGLLDTHTIKWEFGDGDVLIGDDLSPSHTYGDDGVYTVTLTVTDDDGGVGFDILIVTVVNVAPTVEAGNDQMTDEGTTISFSGSYTDPSWLDTHTIVWDFGDGNLDTTNDLYPSHTYGDNGVYTVTLTVTDDDGGVGYDTLTVTVYNVAPTVDAGMDVDVEEGSDYIFAGAFTDPGFLDYHTIEWDFGDGNTAYGTLTPTHAYADNGVYTVTLTVTDDDGGFDSDTLTVTVMNVAPIPGEIEAYMDVDFILTVNGVEWEKVEMWLYEDDTLIGYIELLHPIGSPDFQNGIIPDVRCDMSKQYTATVLYTPPSPYNPTAAMVFISITMVFEDYSQEIMIHHAHPDDPTTHQWDVNFNHRFVNHEITFELTVTDPGADDITLEWDFGDGSTAGPNVYYTDGTFPTEVTDIVYHTYMVEGVYTVRVTTYDDDGGWTFVTLDIYLIGVSSNP